MKKTEVKSYSLRIRVTLAELEELDREAATQATTVSDVIRRRMDIMGHLESSLQDIRREVAHGLSALSRDRPTSDAMTLEMLLLLRDVAGPARQRAAAAELERLGYKPWTPAPEISARPSSW
jgi:hypothetical protein